MINIYRNKIFNSKFLSLFLCLIMFSVSIGLGNFSYAQLQYATSFSTSSDLLGSGTEKDPYQITDAKHLKQMHEDDKFYVLLKNIKVQSHNPIKNFKGTFDGNGFTITINSFQVSTTNMGLFGSASGGARIMNVNVDIQSDVDGTTLKCFGAICGYAQNSSIMNCNSLGEAIEIEGDDIYVGGIVGYSNNEIKNCNNYSDLIVKSKSTKNTSSYVGGIAGHANVVSSCNNYGKIETAFSGNTSTRSNYIGGVSGYSTDELKYCCNNSTSLKVKDKYSKCHVGGIVGYSDSVVSFSTNNANIDVKTATNIAYIGGIVGNSLGLNTLSNNGNVILNTESYEFYMGGISGLDECSDKVQNIVNYGNEIQFDHPRFIYSPDETEEGEKNNQNELKYYIGGLIGNAKSNQYENLYNRSNIKLPLDDNEFFDTKVFKNVGMLIGYQSEITSFKTSYNMANKDKQYLYMYKNRVEDASLYSKTLHETISCSVSRDMSIKAVGNWNVSAGIENYQPNYTSYYSLAFNIQRKSSEKDDASIVWDKTFKAKISLRDVIINNTNYSYHNNKFHYSDFDSATTSSELWGDKFSINSTNGIFDEVKKINNGYSYGYRNSVRMFQTYDLKTNRMSTNWLEAEDLNGACIKDLIEAEHPINIHVVGPFLIEKEGSNVNFYLLTCDSLSGDGGTWDDDWEDLNPYSAENTSTVEIWKYQFASLDIDIIDNKNIITDVQHPLTYYSVFNDIFQLKESNKCVLKNIYWQSA